MDVARHIAETDAANLALVKMERQAFALAHRGKLQQASALLDSAEYLGLKKIYASSMEKTAVAVTAVVEMEKQQLHYLAELSAGANIVGILVLLAAWFFATRSVRRWTTAQREFEDALRKSHDELEFLVTQRTADLSSSNEQLQHEIAEHQRIELVLQESERKFRTITESANDAIIMAAGAGNIIGWNAAAQRMFGYTEAEINGQPLTVLMPERFHNPHREGLSRVAAGGAPHVIGKTVELAGLRKDGSEFPLEMSLSQWHAGDDQFFTAIIRDISERKRAEEMLKESEENYRGFYENSQVGIYRTRINDGKLLIANDAMAKMFGFDSIEEATEKYITAEHYVDPGTRERLVEIIQKYGKFSSFEARLTRNDGGVRWFQYSGQLIQNKGYIEGVVTDITDRKLAEQKNLEGGILLKDALTNAIGAIAATLEQRDPYTAGHQRRVAELAAAIAAEMGLAREVIEGIHFGGLIHDIGKISVPAEILGKPGRLTDIEFGLIKTHAEDGYQIIKGIALPWPVANMVRQHHERLDGSGYPQGLAGEQILLEARILAVADVVEAMSANRPYRPGLGIDDALAEITRGRGSWFDPVAVDACLRLIKEKGFVFTK